MLTNEKIKLHAIIIWVIGIKQWRQPEIHLKRSKKWCQSDQFQEQPLCTHFDLTNTTPMMTLITMTVMRWL